jgi:aminoglycoside phosphotransferase (APT) family kinase protein
MDTPSVRDAISAAKSLASTLGLVADDGAVLHNSNRLTVRLLPCDVVARIAPVSYQASAAFELEIARRLAELGCPVAALEPRVEPWVYVQDEFVINMWTHYEPVSSADIAPHDYAQALERLHAGMREVDLPSPHFTDRVSEAQELVGDRALTPELGDADRDLLDGALRELRPATSQRGAPEQLLHGEPHPGNLLQTKQGLLFIDFETCCRGPVEFDLAHAPDAVAENYPGANQDLIRDCRTLMLAMVAAWRWDRHDQFPNGREMGLEFLDRIRAAMAR